MHPRQTVGEYGQMRVRVLGTYIMPGILQLAVSMVRGKCEQCTDTIEPNRDLRRNFCHGGSMKMSVINTNEEKQHSMHDERRTTGWMQGPAQVGGQAGLAPVANPASGNLSFPIGASLLMPAMHVFLSFSSILSDTGMLPGRLEDS
jgi:hypothetical protein